MVTPEIEETLILSVKVENKTALCPRCGTYIGDRIPKVQLVANQKLS